jgi:hypothetical protein
MKPNVNNLRSRGRPMLAALLAAAAAACDIPTESPTWDTLWVVPGDSVAIQASSFFPSGVTDAPGGGAFVLALPTVTFSRSLGEMCGAACQAANGLTVPKPAFTASFSSTLALPAEVVSASVAGGRIDVRLSHNFSFDPIRPDGAARGYIRVVATSGGTTLATDSVSGDATPFAPGATLARTLTLAAGTATGPVTLTVTVGSPAGGTTRIDTNQRLTVTATPSDVRATQAQVRVATTRTITGTPVELGTTDESDRIEGAAVVVQTENPFAVTGVLNLVFRTSGGQVVTKSLVVGSGSSTGRVQLTADETRAIFQDPAATVTASANFSAPGGVVTVRPGQAVRVRTRLELTIRAGS